MRLSYNRPLLRRSDDEAGVLIVGLGCTLAFLQGTAEHLQPRCGSSASKGGWDMHPAKKLSTRKMSKHHRSFSAEQGERHEQAF